MKNPHALPPQNYWPDLALTQPIVNIGQIPFSQIAQLRKMAKQGKIDQWLGYWDTGTDLFGIGQLKTWWGPIA